MTEAPKPWETEPNEVEFEASGLACRMLRTPDLGCWCGYVGVPSDHPWFGLPYNAKVKMSREALEKRPLQGFGIMDIFLAAMRGDDFKDGVEIGMALECHGGCNYAEDHVPREEPDGRWWFGFDCGHGGDLVPGFLKHGLPRMGDYRDQGYVVAECQHLAEQLANVAAMMADVKGTNDAPC
jgi:hypothetical protein